MDELVKCYWHNPGVYLFQENSYCDELVHHARSQTSSISRRIVNENCKFNCKNVL